MDNFAPLSCDAVSRKERKGVSQRAAKQLKSRQRTQSPLWIISSIRFMKKMVLGILVVGSLAGTSCVKVASEQPLLTNQQLTKKVDSILQKSLPEMQEHARRDLQLRMKIEVKAKADSILKAQQRADTAHPPLNNK